VPNCYEDYEHAELIILIGSNAAWCHPVSFQRIRAAKEANPALKIVVIDPRRTASCDIADLHLPLASGSDAWLFNGLLSYLMEHHALDWHYIDNHTEGFSESLRCYPMEQIAEYCQLPIKDIQRFYDWFTHTDKVLSLYSQGINQSSSGSDKVNAIINCHLATGKIGKVGSGPLSLTGQPNAMGGREVGGLSHQLAAHIEFSDADTVARFWNAPNITTQAGLPAVALFDAIHAGKIKAVWIMGTNPVVSLPNADKIKQALQRCEFVVVSDCIADTDTTALAHVLLPAQGWSEKDGTVTNSERCISRQRALFQPAGNAKPDWWIITQIAHRMGFAAEFNYQSPVDIFREHAALSGFENNGQRDFDISALADMTPADYEQFQPMQWPINAQYPQGRARFFADGQFFTPSGKAQFIAVTPRPPVNAPTADYPLILNTGRLRDQWHTMTRTALAAKLNRHKPEPFIDIHPADATLYGLSANSLAVLESNWGSMIARVQITDNQTQGNVFVPMHWTAQYASHGRMGALVNPEVDPISKQPESKHTPVRIKPYTPLWQGFILSRDELPITEADYWIKSKNDGFYRYELAGNTLPDDWHEYINSKVDAPPQWQEYQDAAKGIYRTARLVNNQLDTVIFIAPDHHLAERNWLSSLFAKTELTKPERMALLTGRPPSGGADVGAIICACFNVGEKTIRAAIKEHGFTTHQQVGQCLKAGTNCGSCVPELKALL
jgi:assimilatory nitrate reductase catalytic subunit